MLNAEDWLELVVAESGAYKRWSGKGYAEGTVLGIVRPGVIGDGDECRTRGYATRAANFDGTRASMAQATATLEAAVMRGAPQGRKRDEEKAAAPLAALTSEQAPAAWGGVTRETEEEATAPPPARPGLWRRLREWWRSPAFARRERAPGPMFWGGGAVWTGTTESSEWHNGRQPKFRFPTLRSKH